MFLSKQVWKRVAGGQNDAQTIEVPRAYDYTPGKAYGNLVPQTTLLGQMSLHQQIQHMYKFPILSPYPTTKVSNL